MFTKSEIQNVTKQFLRNIYCLITRSSGGVYPLCFIRNVHDLLLPSRNRDVLQVTGTPSPTAGFLLLFPGIHSQCLLGNCSGLQNRTCGYTLQVPFPPSHQGIRPRKSPKAFLSPQSSKTYCGSSLWNSATSCEYSTP